MERISLKLACVFIILMFCLSPLSAADLGQDDNNNKYINQNTIDIKTDDIDDATIDDDGIDDGSIKNDDADFSDDSAKANDADFSDDSAKANDADFRDHDLDVVNDTETNVENMTAASDELDDNSTDLIDPNLSIRVDDISEGEKAVALISTNETLSGDARVYLNGSNAVYPVAIANGEGSVTIDEDLALGDHIATVRFLGDDTFKADENSTSFKVNEEAVELVDPNLSIEIEGYLAPGKNPTVIIHADKGFNRYVNIIFNNSNKIYYVMVRDGYAKEKLYMTFDECNYKATVFSYPDEKYGYGSASDTFPVKPISKDMTVHIDNVTYGDDTIIDIYVDERYCNSKGWCVSEGIDDKEVYGKHYIDIYDIYPKRGYCQIRIPGLKPGPYFVTCIDGPAGDCESIFATGYWTVFKADPDLHLSVGDVTINQNAILEINANEKVNGVADVYLNNSSSAIQTNITKGHGSVSFDDMAKGNYTATVKFRGNELFNESEKTTTFKVVNWVPEKINLTFKSTVNVDMNNNSKTVKTEISWAADDEFMKNSKHLDVRTLRDGHLIDNSTAQTHTFTDIVNSDHNYEAIIIYENESSAFGDGIKYNVSYKNLVNNMPVGWDINVIDNSTRNVTETFTPLTGDGGSIINLAEKNYIYTGDDDEHTFSYSYNYNGVDYCFTKTLTFPPKSNG